MMNTRLYASALVLCSALALTGCNDDGGDDVDTDSGTTSAVDDTSNDDSGDSSDDDSDSDDSEDDDAASENQAPTANQEAVVIDEAQQWMAVEGSVSFSDPDGDTLYYSAEMVDADTDEAPAGEVEIDEQTGEYTYIAYDAEPAAFMVTASDGELSAQTRVRVESVVGDPYTDDQWQLRNTGQKAFAQSDRALEGYRDYLVAVGRITRAERETVTFPDNVSVPGVDMNVLPVHAEGLNGRGSIVVVADTGLEIRHRDLRDNILPGASLNFLDDAFDPTDPTNRADRTGDHGTSVAGLVAASAGNGIGGRGAAPEASLVGMNYLKVQTVTTEMLAHGMAGQSLTPDDNVVAFNRSYGITAPIFFNIDPIDELIESYPALNLRHGLGALNVKSNGNSWSDDGQTTRLCTEDGVAPNSYGLSCIDGNMAESSASPYTVAVAAINADGTRSSYSTPGANLFVSGPAGEFGFRYPAMITTDQSTCLQGYSGFPAAERLAALYGYSPIMSALYPFDAPSVGDLNPGCEYTSTFNGTSSAAPNVTGVIALIAEANPDLDWRQIKDILARTSRPIDVDDGPVVLQIDGDEWTAYPGWIENAAGLSFNRKYGFGLVDAAAAVERAENDPPELGELRDTDWVPSRFGKSLEIPDNDASGATARVNIEQAIEVEALQLRLTVRNPEMAWLLTGDDDGDDDNTTLSSAGVDLAIEVISPAGTRSVVLTSKQSLVYPAAALGIEGADGSHIMLDQQLLANAFYGESAKGMWTVRLIDTSDASYQLANGGSLFGGGALSLVNNQENSTLEALDVRVMGH